MDFNEQLPDWQPPGTEPPASKKSTGFVPGEKPPADYFNWLFTRISKVAAEIRTKLAAVFHGTTGHKHTGVDGDGAKIDHEHLLNKGTNTHAQIDAHIADGSAHGATSAATANAIARRDASGRMKAAAPSSLDDVARKQEVDAIRSDNTKELVAEVRTTDPTSPAVGRIWFRSDLT